MSRFYDFMANVVRRAFDARIDAPAILDLDTEFPRGRAFVEHWRTIRDEARALAVHVDAVPRFHEILSEQKAISDNDGRDWRVFMLKAYGVEFPENMARCPTLRRLIQATPDVLSASFSLMAPHKHIPAHRGPFRGILRFTMSLVMPRGADGAPATVLKIAHDEFRLAEGEPVLWDDTYVHEAWNESGAWRIALVMDVRRRRLPLDLRILSAALIWLTGAVVRLRGTRYAALAHDVVTPRAPD
jgi:aspartate beta-hydroxylase